jgi:polysaccharide export outer membrane protein
MRRFLVSGLLLVTLVAFSQETTEESSDLPQVDAIMAMTRPDYPVTPGDVYRLSYVSSVGSVELSVVVSSDYHISFGFLGSIDARGLTFAGVTARVQSLVRRTYPNSYPELTILSVGEYEVYVDGYVDRTGYVVANGLSRLSDVVEPLLLDSSSLRNIALLRDGRTSRHDLYAAQRLGRLQEDPYLRPGDRISIAAAERLVRLSGLVNRAGRYELLEGEQLSVLMNEYGAGPSPGAALDRIHIDRYSGDESPTRIVIDSGEPFELLNGDCVAVPSQNSYLPAVVFRGAVTADPDDSAQTIVQTSESDYDTGAQFSYRFRPGQTLGDTVRSIEDRISPQADLSSAEYYRRSTGETVAIDLECLYYGTECIDDLVLGPGDLITIPFRPRFVIVAGAVSNPGSYTHAPGRTAEYYINLAGGYDPARTWSRKPEVIGPNGEPIAADEPVPVEATIVVPANNPFYSWELGAIVSLVSGIISIVMLFFE